MKRPVQPIMLFLFIVISLVLIGSAYFTLRLADQRIKRGLDISGGLYVLLEAVQTGEQEVDRDAIERAITIIRRRVDELGVAEPLITAQGDERVRIELPEIDDVERAREIIGQTARLSFVGPDGEEVISGEHLVTARVERDQFTAQPYVSLEFDREGKELFAAATHKYLGEQIAIYLDDELVSAPVVNNVITEGKAIIQGDFTLEEAADLAMILRSGALPVELRELEYRLIGPTLGHRTEEIGIWAAAVGLAAVFLFMVIYYRLPGLVAGIALVFYLALVLGALMVLSATLTLPGIAGIILSIGMAVDANVIIFERIKEEVRSGRTVRTALESGFQRAFPTILDANITTVIAAVVLFALASGPVRGFAVTLLVGIICSMLTAIILTRLLLRLVYRAGLIRSASSLGVRVNV